MITTRLYVQCENSFYGNVWINTIFMHDDEWTKMKILYIQCDAIRWKQLFLRKCRLGQIYLSLSMTTSPQKLLPADCITQYEHWTDCRYIIYRADRHIDTYRRIYMFIRYLLHYRFKGGSMGGGGGLYAAPPSHPASEDFFSSQLIGHIFFFVLSIVKILNYLER